MVAFCTMEKLYGFLKNSLVLTNHYSLYSFLNKLKEIRKEN